MRYTAPVTRTRGAGGRKRRGPSSPRAPEASAATRDALVAAAIELFAEKGLDAPSLDEICARAGFTRGAFYVYFKDREELIGATLQAQTEGLLALLFADSEEPDGLRLTIERFAEAMASGLYPPPGGIRLHHLLTACARSTEVRERQQAINQEAIDRMAKLVHRGQHEGRVRQDVEPSRVSTLLLSLFEGLQVLGDVGTAFDPRALSRELLKLLAPPPP
jgi:AcrR family transcriptional regulator